MRPHDAQRAATARAHPCSQSPHEPLHPRLPRRRGRRPGLLQRGGGSAPRNVLRGVGQARPESGARWSGLSTSDGAPIDVEDLPVTQALRDGRPFHAEYTHPLDRRGPSTTSRSARCRSSRRRAVRERSSSSGPNGRGRLRMRLKVWGARGSVPAPGPEMNRYGGNTSCVQLTLSDGTRADPRRRHGHPQPRRRPRGEPAEGQHPPHPPPPRPHPGADVLPALLPLRGRDHDLGAGLAGGLARGPDRALHLGAAVAGRGPRASL